MSACKTCAHKYGRIQRNWRKMRTYLKEVLNVVLEITRHWFDTLQYRSAVSAPSRTRTPETVARVRGMLYGRRLFSGSSTSLETSSSSSLSSWTAGAASSTTVLMSQFSASLAVYFKVPDQGMTEYEILSRCTATPLRPTRPKGPHRFLAAAHTVQPWGFPHFYRKPWLLQFVNEAHVRYYVELREPSGAIIAKHELLNRPNRHPTRDIAALKFLNEAQALDDIRSRGVPFTPLTLRTTPLGPGEATDIVGYEVVEDKEIVDDVSEEDRPVRVLARSRREAEETFADDGDVFKEFRGRADPTMIFRRPRAFLALRTARQAFVKADTELKAGMCGGAVLDMNLECCGCIEGVVPTPPPGANIPEDRRLLVGAACMIESTDLANLLEDDDLFSF